MTEKAKVGALSRTIHSYPDRGRGVEAARRLVQRTRLTPGVLRFFRRLLAGEDDKGSATLTKATLCIFVKPPLPGLVKTRLSVSLTATEAAGLAAAFFADTFALASSCEGGALSWHATDIRRMPRQRGPLAGARQGERVAKNAAARPAASVAVRETDSRVLTKPGKRRPSRRCRELLSSASRSLCHLRQASNRPEEAKHARCQPGSLVRVSEPLPHLGLGRIGMNRPRESTDFCFLGHREHDLADHLPGVSGDPVAPRM